MPKIKGVHDETYEIDSVGKTYTFTKTYRGHDPVFYAIREDGSNNKIILHGIAESNAGFSAICSEGDGVTIRIASDGRVRGDGSPIECRGADASVINAGKIFGIAGYGGVRLSAVDSEFINKGKVYADYGAVRVSGDGSRIVNDKGALISGDSYPVFLAGVVDVDLKFVNHGTVKSAATAVRGDVSNDTVINNGKIIGTISLWDGNDKIDARSGEITGAIYGGDGNDVLITDRAGHKLLEGFGEGYDTVKSTVSYTLSENVERLVLLGRKDIDGTGTGSNDTLTGNAGNNVLRGLEGSDWLVGNAGKDVLRGGGGDDMLFGGAGKDVLQGGAGIDTFVFETGDGKDTITDFEKGIDRIDVIGWTAITDFNDLLDNHASNHGADVWIKAGSDVLIVKNMRKADLDAGDFDF